ncbi:thioredoxin [Vibrio phage Va2]|nr:thioredoxin [Vibrio phage Va2]
MIEHVKLENFVKTCPTLMDKPVFLLMMNKGCQSCEAMFQIVRDIAEDYEGEAYFFGCNIEAEEMPLFGPPAIPSLVGFVQGSRFFEGVGEAPEELVQEQISNFIDMGKGMISPDPENPQEVNLG